jgi:hypothetical protein
MKKRRLADCWQSPAACTLSAGICLISGGAEGSRLSSGVGFSGVCHASDELSMLSRTTQLRRELTIGELMVKAVRCPGFFRDCGPGIMSIKGPFWMHGALHFTESSTTADGGCEHPFVGS